MVVETHGFRPLEKVDTKTARQRRTAIPAQWAPQRDVSRPGLDEAPPENGPEIARLSRTSQEMPETGDWLVGDTGLEPVTPAM